LKASGPSEDKVYALHPELEKNIRRGNTYLEVYDANDYSLFKHTIVARKGLQKFYDMRPEYLVSDEDFKNGYTNLKSGKAVSDSNLRNYIFSGAVNGLNNGACIEVIKTLKMNGENAQISWVKEESMWCIASKNVGILANNVADLKKYDVSSTDSRFKYAVMIANCWFKIINRLGKFQKSSAKLQKALSGKTLVGEFVGHPDNQHLVKYTRETIIFYAVIDNNDIKQNCLLPEDAYKIFNEFELDCVPTETIGMFNNIDSLSDALNHEYKLVSQGSIKSEEEGAVIYMVSRGVEHESVLSLSKYKTLEYRILRKLREKLRNFWSKHEKIEGWTNELQSLYDKTYSAFMNESKELIGTHKLPQTNGYYAKFADQAFKAVLEDNTLYEKLLHFYVSFLEDITYSLNKDHKIFTSQVFRKTESKCYKRQSGKISVDNESWRSRKPNTSYYRDLVKDTGKNDRNGVKKDIKMNKNEPKKDMK
jgi:hypothetical protein